MAELFKKDFTNYDETPLTQAKDLNIKVSDMIIRELLPDVDYDDWREYKRNKENIINSYSSTNIHFISSKYFYLLHSSISSATLFISLFFYYFFAFAKVISIISFHLLIMLY